MNKDISRLRKLAGLIKEEEDFDLSDNPLSTQSELLLTFEMTEGSLDYLELVDQDFSTTVEDIRRRLDEFIEDDKDEEGNPIDDTIDLDYYQDSTMYIGRISGDETLPWTLGVMKVEGDIYEFILKEYIPNYKELVSKGDVVIDNRIKGGDKAREEINDKINDAIEEEFY
jgi:hypothetical protein